jgi:L-alanine-DL-glutamate epimerase-like enolase superfamily enzyme
MNRREFIAGCGGLAVTGCLTRCLGALDLPRDFKITRIVGFDLISRRGKMIGKNSRLDVHGDRATERMVRLFSNAGLEGLGHCRATERALSSLLGRNPFDFSRTEQTAIESPLGAANMALWDLIGRALNRPVYELLEARGSRSVPVYDGSIYFADLLPQYAGRWSDRFKEEIDLGFKRGHRAFKIKIGRGAKWMPSEEGYDRDKEVLKTIRQHVGPEIALGVDANNGYDLGRTKRLLADLPDIRLTWLEEMFPEQVDQYLDLKVFFADRKLKTLIADGETQNTLEPFRPFVAAKAIDILQGDMNHFGIEGILAEAALAKPNGLLVGPHNWASLLGYYTTLHIGRAITNFFRAEHDPLDNDILIADGYTISEGLATVPDAPGFGLKIDEEKFAATVKPRFDLKL